MKQIFLYLIVIFVILCFIFIGFKQNKMHPVKPGIEVLFEKHIDLIRGKRVGLIINPTSVDHNLKRDIELFRAHPDVKLVALYGPEHGVRGNTQAGETVSSYFDQDDQIQVYSLYDQAESKASTNLKNIDQRMRSSDTQHIGKQLQKQMLNTIDVMVFDLQDVGTRVYTYIATMAYAMEACAEAGIPFIVLDRPNPINGLTMEGPILEYPKYRSFIGLYPIPLRHGMTVGELAHLFNEKYLSHKVKLTVIPMENWRRKEWYDQTHLPWILPSPNLPTLASATIYPGQVMLEGTNLSEGRGTTKPFELFGAPWINGFVLTNNLNALHLPGVTFREAWFTPSFSKFQGMLCGGSEIYVTDRKVFRPVATSIAILATVKQLYGDKLQFHADYFDHVMGTSNVREALERGESAEKIVAEFEPGLNNFSKLRESFLLY